MPATQSEQCIAKVSRYGGERLHVIIPPDMRRKFTPGMTVEVIEVRKKTVIAEGERC